MLLTPVMLFRIESDTSLAPLPIINDRSLTIPRKYLKSPIHAVETNFEGSAYQNSDIGSSFSLLYAENGTLQTFLQKSQKLP